MAVRVCTPAVQSGWCDGISWDSPCPSQRRQKRLLHQLQNPLTLKWLEIMILKSALHTGGHGPVDVERRIEAFLADFEKQLEAMDGADFEFHRSSLIASKLQKDRSLGEEADRHWEQIFNRRCFVCTCVI